MELGDAIFTRTSVRYYQEREVEEEKIKELIEAAIRAPTASGLENWLFVIFKSSEAKKKVYELIAKGMIEYYQEFGLSMEKIEKLKKRIYEGKMYSAPLYIGVFMNKNVRFLKGEKFDLLEFVWSVESAAMAIQNLMLKAVELGLGTCYMGVTNFEGIEEEIRSVAGLGEEWYLVGLITAGYPLREEKPRKRRKDFEEVVTFV
ncbi:nitroreductase family protein [Palaeococcus sp. (in: euryarchaeotes)]